MGKGSLKWIVIFSIATNLLMIVPPLHMLQVYDRVLSSNSLETLIYLTLIAVGAMILFGVAEAIRGVLAQRAAAKYTIALSDPLFERLSHENRGPMHSSQILRDFNTVRGFIASRTMLGLFDLPFAPFFLMLMFLLHWTIGILTCIGILALVLMAVWQKRATAEKSKEAKQADASALTFAQTVFSRSEDIRAMGLLPSVMERWGGQMGQSLVSSDEANSQSAAFYGMSKAVRKVLQILIMAWGAFLVIQGDISAGVIFAASMLSGRALQPFEQVIGGWERIGATRVAQSNLDEFLGAGNGREEPLRLPDPMGDIEVQDLVYNPSEDDGAKPVLDHVSFHIEAGKILAVIGPSGAGKSSIAKALVGAINIDGGQIRLDGAERNQWPEAQWGETVGYVSQEITLFPGTLAENIARLEVRPDEDRVIAAAQAAGIHDMITHLPNGYGTVIGPGKVLLSGGQKQRVALARALYSNPRVLVLDEPNAHLDQHGEGSLLEAMKRARDDGRTIIIITQRRSVLEIADFVMTVRDGKIDGYQAASATKGLSSRKSISDGSIKSKPATKQRVQVLQSPAKSTSAAVRKTAALLENEDDEDEGDVLAMARPIPRPDLGESL